MKKYFIGKMPCGVCMYLFVVTRLIVDSCMPMSSATSLRTIGFRLGNALLEKFALKFDDAFGHFVDRFVALFHALDEPLRRAEPFLDIFLGDLVDTVLAGSAAFDSRD